MITAFFLGGAVISTAVSRLIHKYVLKDADAYAYALLTNIVGSIIFLPFALTNWKFPTEPQAFYALCAAAIVWTLISVLNYISYKKTDLSIREPISQTRVLWVLLLGILFLGESFTAVKVAATLLLFIGLLILLYHPVKKWESLSHSGVRYTFVSAILPAIVAALDTYSLRYFNVGFYGFLVFFIPTLFLLAALPTRKNEVQFLLKNKYISALLGILISTLNYYLILRIYQRIPLTITYPILQLGSVLTVISAIFIFKKKEHMSRKIIATLIIISSVILFKFA